MIAQVAGTPPDTSAYYHIAYAWAALLYSGYAAWLWLRARRVWARLLTVSRPDAARSR
jgi:hypothetical protein